MAPYLDSSGCLYCPNIIFFCRLSRISAKTFAKKSLKKNASTIGYLRNFLILRQCMHLTSRDGQPSFCTGKKEKPEPLGSGFVSDLAGGLLVAILELQTSFRLLLLLRRGNDTSRKNSNNRAAQLQKLCSCYRKANQKGLRQPS